MAGRELFVKSSLPFHLAQSSHYSLPLASPTPSMVALLRCRWHRSLSGASFTLPYSATGRGRVTEPLPEKLHKETFIRICFEQMIYP